MMTLAAVSTHQPGAVPLGFAMAEALGMSQACLRLTFEKGRPRLAQSSRSQASRSRIDDRLLAEGGCDALAREVVRRRARGRRW